MSLQDITREEYHSIHENQDMNHIWGRVYLGSYEATQNLPELQKHNIRTILTVMDTEIPAANRHPTVKYHYIPAHDIWYQDLMTTFDETYDIIDTAVTSETGILVHSAAGKSRSAATVISYLMKKLGKPYEEVRDLVDQKRPHINPNEGFVAQLGLFLGLLW